MFLDFRGFSKKRLGSKRQRHFRNIFVVFWLALLMILKRYKKTAGNQRQTETIQKQFFDFWFEFPQILRFTLEFPVFHRGLCHATTARPRAQPPRTAPDLCFPAGGVRSRSLDHVKRPISAQRSPAAAFACDCKKSVPVISR